MNTRLSVLASVALGALCAGAGCSDDPADPGGAGGISAGRSGGGTAGTRNVPRGGSAGSNSTAGSKPEGATDAGGAAPSNAGAGGDVAAEGGEAGAGGSGGDGGAGGAGPAANITLEAVNGTLQGGEAAAKTLYFFGGDLPAGSNSGPMSACAAACNDMWPVFHEETVVAGAGLRASDFGEFVRPDGKPQTTFKGWPLYSHTADTVAGDRIGDGKLMLWHAVEQPFYSLILRQAMIGPAVVTYMADGAGYTIYKLSGDTPGNATTKPVSTCITPGCVRAWPAVSASLVKPVSSITGTFDIFKRETGAVQFTYNGLPLYGFIHDVAPGDAKGFDKPLWGVATP